MSKGLDVEDDHGRRDIDRADPVAHDGRESRRSAVRAQLFRKRVADLAVAADLERPKLLQIARNGRLGDFEAEAAQMQRKFFLARQRLASDQVRHRFLPSFL